MFLSLQVSQSMPETLHIHLGRHSYLEADPAAVVPLLPTRAAGHKGHGVLVGAALPHPRWQEEGPPGHLRHPTVRPPASFAADPLRRRAFDPSRELPLADPPERVLLPELPQLRVGHLLRGHPGEGLGRQGAAQEAPGQVPVFRIPQVGHLAPHACFVLGGFVELVDVPLDVAGQLCGRASIGKLGAEGSEKELNTFGSHGRESARRGWALC